MIKISIASRGSRLALRQAQYVKDRLEAVRSDITVTFQVVKTRGDVILDVPLSKVGGKGVFVKEIEQALLSGAADIAVHSMKDMPAESAPGLTLGIVPEREDPADMLLSARYGSLEELPLGAAAGTSSLRRQAQLLALRPDLQVRLLRGNVDTRLCKLMDGQFDVIVLAAAGLKRLGLSAPFATRLEPSAFVPAVGQGALGIEFGEDRDDLRELLGFMEDPASRIRVEAERGLLAGLEGSCRTPIAGYAVMLDPETLRLEGLVASPDGRKVVRRGITAPASEARAAGLSLARTLLQEGAGEILAELRGADAPHQSK